MSSPSTAADSIVEHITIHAPAGRVFDAFTDPAERVKWWHVAGRFETTRAESDLQAGGRWAMEGRRPDGRPFTVRGTYRTVERPFLLEFTWLPDWQGDGVESVVRVELTEDGGTTHVRLTHSGLVTDRARESHRGWPQLLGLLKAHAEAR